MARLYLTRSSVKCERINDVCLNTLEYGNSASSDKRNTLKKVTQHDCQDTVHIAHYIGH